MNGAVNASLAGKTEEPAPEPVTPPEAKKSSGPETSTSVPGPRKKRLYVSIPGAKELRCMGCNGFIGEVKGTVEKSRFLCRSCGLMNSFSFSA